MEEEIFNKAQVILQNLLKETRKRSNKSQVELAELTGFTQSAISKCESGERTLGIIELKMLCDALDIKLADFVKELERRIAESGNYET